MGSILDKLMMISMIFAISATGVLILVISVLAAVGRLQ